MKRTLAILLCGLCYALQGPHSAQAQAWKANLDMEIFTPSMSDDGQSLVFFTKKNIQCYDVGSGTVRWTRDIEKYIEGFQGKFINNKTFVAGLGNHFDFIDAATGQTQTTLPIIGESWKDLRYDSKAMPETDTLKPHFWGNLGIFYWDDGFQIIDFDKAAIIHQGSEPIKYVKYETFQDYTMIWSLRGSDTAYFLDTKNKKIVYQMYTGSNGPNGSVYQHFVVQNDQLLVMTEKNIMSVNLPTQHVDALIPVDPDDPDVYMPVLTKDALYILTSDNNKQTLYDGKSGAQLWQTAENVIPGIAEELTPIENSSDGLLVSYHKSGKIGVYRLNMKTGAVAWSKLLAEQDGSYSPGHHKSSKTFAVLGAIAMNMVANAMNRGMATHTNMGNGMVRTEWHESRINWEGVAKSINRNQESDGFAKVLEVNPTKATFILGGKLYAELEKSSHDTYDGEGIVVLNLADGSVVKNLPAKIISKASKKMNAAKDLNVQQIGNANVIVGARNVHVYRNEGIESFTFGDDDITYIGADDKQVQFVTNHEDDYFDYWSIDASVTPAKKTLLARSTKNNLVFNGTANFTATLNITKKQIEAYAPISGDATAKPTFTDPPWKLTEDDLDKLDVGSLADNKTNTDSIQGIRVDGNDLYLMGSDKIGKATIRQDCKWAAKWNPDPLKTVMGVTPLGKGLVYASGKYCGIVSNDCSGAEIATHKISPEYASVFHAPNDDTIIMDRNDGLLFCYKLKKQ
jgi:hypothetical protein